MDSPESLLFSAIECLLSRRDAAQELTDGLKQLRIEANYHEMPRRLLRHVQNARKLAEKLETDRLTDAQKAKIGSELAAIDSVIYEAASVEDINLPGYDFHGLQGFNPKRYTVHVNGPWCLSFEFEGGNAYQVDFEQYH